MKKPAYKSFRLSKRIKHPVALTSSRTLFYASLLLLWRHKKLFGGITLVYAFAQFLLVQGLLAANFSTVAQLVEEQLSGLMSGVTLFAVLVGSSNQNVSAEGSVYQLLLLIIVSLALVWALRHVSAGKSVRVRDAYYKGMYPLIPFVLVFLVILLQIVPFLLGSWLYQTTIAAGIAVSAVEHVFWLVVAGIFALLSGYMMTSSLIALYIVTLPDVTPMQALRSARGLVLHRRGSIFWRIFALGMYVTTLMALIVIPVIMLASSVAPYVFYLVGVLIVTIIHTYMYSLYRELLTDD